MPNVTSCFSIASTYRFWPSVLGLTGVEGFLFYMVVSVLIGVGMSARMGFQASKFLHPHTNTLTLVLGGVSSQIMSFIMFWTLAYSLMFVY